MDENKSVDIPKEKYKDIVRYTLNCMLDLAKEDVNYNVHADLQQYYTNAIQREAVLTEEEFVAILKEVNFPKYKP